ncbi:MAG: hypothetical protein M3Z05_15730 [Gemmatimonadota bacterium]|nr:hypothetical protein [Gemmatimonadota bacterium]
MNRCALLASLALLGVSGGALAQASAKPAPPPAPRPRIGYAGTPTPPPPPQPAPQPVYIYAPGGYVTYGAPYEALSDGSVLVNFGSGYERVLRQCANPAYNSTQVNQNGRDALGRILDPPGIAALKAGTRGQATGSQPARSASACYRADQQGRVEMVTESSRVIMP